MRGYIFTRRERQILEIWLSKGMKLEDFRVLKHLIQNNFLQLEKDYKLLQKALGSFSD